MYKLIKYNDGHYIDLYYWVNEEDTLASPIFESELDAKDWANGKSLVLQE